VKGGCHTSPGASFLARPSSSGNVNEVGTSVLTVRTAQDWLDYHWQHLHSMSSMQLSSEEREKGSRDARCLKSSSVAIAVWIRDYYRNYDFKTRRPIIN
jgi:hypothetical protein